MPESMLVDIHERPPEAKAKEAVVEEARISRIQAWGVSNRGFNKRQFIISCLLRGTRFLV